MTGLLQLSTVWHLWQPSPASPGYTKYRSMPCYWHSTEWADHNHLEATSLATSMTAYRIKADLSGLQGAEWSAVPECQLTITSRCWRLRWSNITTSDVPWARTSLGDRSLTVAGPRLWDNLPLNLCDGLPIVAEKHLFCWGSRCRVTKISKQFTNQRLRNITYCSCLKYFTIGSNFISIFDVSPVYSAYTHKFLWCKYSVQTVITYFCS